MVGALTHRALRLRAARALRHARTRKPPAAPTPTPARGVKPSTPKPAVTSGRGGTDPVLLAVAATIGALGIAALVGTLIQVRLRKSRYGGRPAYLGPWRRWRGQAPRQPTDLVLGYAVVPARGRERAEKEFRDQAEAIVAECRRRDLRLLQVIREPEFGDEGGTARPGLTYALRRISVGEARGLVVADLMRLAPTVSELRQVLDSLGESGARLVAAAQGLDTYEEAGEVAARVVLDLAESEHAALAEAADDPELRRRIARMRAYGMTTLEIVERLRQEGITSGRGSGRWRPSSRRPG
jgi:hypothetical protein